MRKNGGLTLAEIVLAIGVLGIVALTVIGLFVKLLGSQSKSSHGTVGRFIANAVGERAALSGPPNWGMVDINVPQTETTRLHNQDALVTYTTTITATPLRSAPASNPMGELWFLEIEISWWNDEAARVDFGKTHVKTSRVVYIEN